MGGITDSLFGADTPEQSSSQSTGGFAALPADIQNQYRGILNKTQRLTNSPQDYFRPMDMTQGEIQAGQLIDPNNIQASIEQYLNPFRNIITQDINEQFEDQRGTLSSRISEAGAFGSSRAREGQADLERERLDAIARAQAGQYNTAYNQLQGGIANLLNFGGFERGLDLSQRQALPQSLQFASNIFSPLLNANQSTSSQTAAQSDSGIVGDVVKIAGLIGAFSDKKLKKNIEKIGNKNGLNLYKYEYLWSPQKFIGFMSDEVKKIYPEAVQTFAGYDMVNYGAIK